MLGDARERPLTGRGGTCRSNIPDVSELLFELVTGRTEQTNKFKTFLLESEGQEAHIKLGRYLDYESTIEYILTVRVQNKYNLAAETQIMIHVEDVNDNIPAFTELVSGSVLEKEPPGTPVMQVRAIDTDGTSAHNQVGDGRGTSLPEVRRLRRLV